MDILKTELIVFGYQFNVIDSKYCHHMNQDQTDDESVAELSGRVGLVHHGSKNVGHHSKIYFEVCVVIQMDYAGLPQ